jgi:hypothetical protein
VNEIVTEVAAMSHPDPPKPPTDEEKIKWGKYLNVV